MKTRRIKIWADYLSDAQYAMDLWRGKNQPNLVGLVEGFDPEGGAFVAAEFESDSVKPSPLIPVGQC